MIVRTMELYHELLSARKAWIDKGGNYWMSVAQRTERAQRQSKLKPGKDWPRTNAWSIIQIIDGTKPKARPYNHEAILDWQHMLIYRKRWKRVTPHHGYLFWERMK